MFQQNDVSTLDLGDRDARRPITDYAFSKSGAVFLTAYYDAGNPSSLPDEFHIVRLDTATYRLLRKTVRSADINSTQPWGCFGSILKIVEQYETVAIETHINPSAGCVFLFSSALQFHTALPGILLAQGPHSVLIEANTMHFAPTHPGKLLLLDLRSLQTKQIYPIPKDPHRVEFLHRLQANAPAAAWCHENNNPCDLTNFTTDFSSARYDDSQHEFRFDATLSAESMGPKAVKMVGSRTDHYQYALPK